MSDARVSAACPSCGESTPVDANFCEACGSEFSAAERTGDATPTTAVSARPCSSCGAAPREITVDGWCQQCGHRQPAPEDHVVVDLGSVAMVSDRGQRHRHNEDAGAVRVGAEHTVLVVCDGVSSTSGAHHAAQKAAATVADELIRRLETDAPETAPVADARAALAAAAEAAQTSVAAVQHDGTGDPPSCTLVAAVLRRQTVTVGWLGDSRAWWLPADGAVQELTTDHSWAEDERRSGNVDEAAISADARAHSITRWLGADSADAQPEIIERQLDGAGVLLLCSDGLWNELDSPAHAAELVRQAESADHNMVEVAATLVDVANNAGGRDNITVAVAAVHEAEPDQAPQ